jgi:hypothetical protein
MTPDNIKRLDAAVALADGLAERIAGARALYARPGTPGEKAAALEALRRMGIDPTTTPSPRQAPGPKRYSVHLLRPDVRFMLALRGRARRTRRPRWWRSTARI